jgi:hypothetical protein
LLQRIKINTDAEECRDLAGTVISELVRHSVAEQGARADDDEARVSHCSESRIHPAARGLENILRDHVSDEENEQLLRLRA